MANGEFMWVWLPLTVGNLIFKMQPATSNFSEEFEKDMWLSVLYCTLEVWQHLGNLCVYVVLQIYVANKPLHIMCSFGR